MSEDRSIELVRELAVDLEPVRPIPRLRVALGALLAVWLLVAVVGVALRGLRPDLVGSLVAHAGVAAVFGGLGIAGVGGLVAALALGVPGRQRLATAALLVGLLGMALAAGVGSLLFLRSPLVELRASLTSDLTCLAVACAVALLPAGGVVWFAGRAAPYRPLVLVLAAAAGSAALGALTAQASCPTSDFRHLLVGHALAPAVGALLLTIPLLAALKRFRR